MGLVFKSFLIVILILLVLTLVELISYKGFFTKIITDKIEKLSYVFEIEGEYITKVSIIEIKNISREFFLKKQEQWVKLEVNNYS